MNYIVEKLKRWFKPNKFTYYKGKGRSNVKFMFKFDESCLYELPSLDYGQWNKLIGLSDYFCWHKRNSVRMAWRGDIKGIQICMYVRKRGKLQELHVHNIEINRMHVGEVGIEKDYYYMKFDNKEYRIKRSVKRRSGWNYLLTPHFGGKYAAPHKMNLYLKTM